MKKCMYLLASIASVLFLNCASAQDSYPIKEQSVKNLMYPFPKKGDLTHWDYSKVMQSLQVDWIKSVTYVGDWENLFNGHRYAEYSRYFKLNEDTIIEIWTITRDSIEQFDAYYSISIYYRCNGIDFNAITSCRTSQWWVNGDGRLWSVKKGTIVSEKKELKFFQKLFRIAHGQRVLYKENPIVIKKQQEVDKLMNQVSKL